MGYDLHITRAEEWSESETQPISLEEWLSYVRDDPEMRLDGYAEAKTPTGETIHWKNEGLAVWTGYGANERGENMAWFYHLNGMIVVKNPDEKIIAKMRSMAKAFHARVQGDEGEFY